MGDDFFGVIYGGVGNTAAMMYGKASFLLDWNGGGSAFMNGNDDSSDPTNGAWTTDIGKPVATKQAVGIGLAAALQRRCRRRRPERVERADLPLGGGYVSPTGATVTSSRCSRSAG